MAAKIQIDEKSINTFLDSYNKRTEDIKKRATTTFPWSPSAEMNLGAAFTTRLGNPAFSSGAKLTKAIENVRTNLFGRMQATYADTHNIYGGFANLKKDTNATEHLNTLTGEQFANYIPKTPPALKPQGGPDSIPQGGS